MYWFLSVMQLFKNQLIMQYNTKITFYVVFI